MAARVYTIRSTDRVLGQIGIDVMLHDDNETRAPPE
ncbi:hypothetical protein FEZ63_07300 [Microvirga brassicacearum]|uniref:Uncharacterized protein n=1 Tax=Microvirga brassicacearum TaxID=2580413 RepID=A0A5N3PDS3_9HYPH|nr:hypothetical protein FEZ63_07300 [Microvirga brassicacearum]